MYLNCFFYTYLIAGDLGVFLRGYHQGETNVIRFIFGTFTANKRPLSLAVFVCF